MSDADFTRLRKIVHEHTGITIADGRRSMMESRLNKRLRALNLATYKAYIGHLASDPGELQELTNRITTNETYFYRTPRIWSHFSEELVPRFRAGGTGRPMRVWSAAASSGEEAHTIGVFLEAARQQHPGFDYTILGTDISSQVLATATTGVYNGRSVARFQAEQPRLFDRYMTGSETEGWKAVPEIRSRLTFEKHNLLEPKRNTAPFDVIFLRNVLIYFTAADQVRILSHIRKQMHQDGTLFIGESESLKHLATDFLQVAPIIYKVAPVALEGGR